MVIKLVISLLTFLFIIITVLPIIRSDFWTFRILEYPRLQKMVIGLVVLLLMIFFHDELGNWYLWFLIPTVLCLIYLATKIYPYTELAPKEMKTVPDRQKDEEIKILAANVFQDNHEYDKILGQIKETDPDIVFLVETDAKWDEAVSHLIETYPYSLKEILDNTYGMIFYSRLPMQEGAVKYLVEKEVPSVEVTVEMKNGVPVKIYGLHPKPPVPNEALRSTAKDKELMKVALDVEHYEKPCIVMGDLNDVAWSYVTELFRKVSGLIDPRRGRGFYSTFSANHWWMRFPLDYIFCSSDFGLVKMKRLSHNGSDHFPMFIHLRYKKSLEEVQEAPEPDEEDIEDAMEKATEKTDDNN